MNEYEEQELARLIDAGEISPEEVAEIEREDERRNEIRKEEAGEVYGDDERHEHYSHHRNHDDEDLFS